MLSEQVVIFKKDRYCCFCDGVLVICRRINQADLNTISIKRQPRISGTINHLPASKSISNRVLILDALAGNKSTIHNLSDANDTQLMLKLVRSAEKTIDVEDAGTTMRFLTALFSITNQNKILTGTARMQERPIGILVDALRALGGEIDYLSQQGYPPLETKQFSGQKTSTLPIRGDISSQFISALMMIAPTLPNGLVLTLEGKVGSRPYIEMTAALMREFGATCDVREREVSIPKGSYHPIDFTVESDWSATSYWFSFAALAHEANIRLPRLFPVSLQGDSAIVRIMESLGIQSNRDADLLTLQKTSTKKDLAWDFTHCPDLAQTVAVVCAATGIEGHFTGLESLRIKETDRIAALQTELRKIGADLVEQTNSWTLLPSAQLPASATFSTYKDHRMAMAFAPLATLMDVVIENPSVVRKSYPRFWDDMKLTGFIVD